MSMSVQGTQKHQTPEDNQHRAFGILLGRSVNHATVRESMPANDAEDIDDDDSDCASIMLVVMMVRPFDSLSSPMMSESRRTAPF